MCFRKRQNCEFTHSSAGVSRESRRGCDRHNVLGSPLLVDFRPPLSTVPSVREMILSRDDSDRAVKSGNEESCLTGANP
jgi:hypothetical protein